MFPTSFSRCPRLMSKVHSDVLCQTGRVWASRPAKKGGRSVKEKKNSNADVMYICVPMCHVALLCYLLVHLWEAARIAMKGLSVKPDSLEQPARDWVGQGKQGIFLRRRTNRRLSLSLDQGHEGWFARCFKKIAVQVCTNYNYVFFPIWSPQVPVICTIIILCPGADLPVRC